MKNIIKTLIILTAFSFTTAQAGELAVSGSAKASYSITSSDGAAGAISTPKAIGVENDMSFKASGETDMGWTWSYHNDFDAAGVIDDSRLAITTPYGMVAFNSDEGGVGTDTAWNQSAYARPSDTSFDEGMAGEFDAADLTNIEYKLPAVLPFSTTFEIAYAPGTETTVTDEGGTGSDVNRSQFTPNTATAIAQTTDMGDSMTQTRVTMSPIDGLKIGASYTDFTGVNDAKDQKPESGAYYVTYAAGPATIGYGKMYVAYALSGLNDFIESVEGTSYSAAFALNDDLTVSYTHEESNPDNQTAATANYTLESSGIQAAYTMGGMTVSVAMNDHENVAYTDGKDVKDTVFSVSMAF